MKNKLSFILGAKKIISVNALYKAKITYIGGRQVATIYKSKEAKMTETYIKEQVESLDVPNNYPWINKDTLFRMTIKVVFKSGIFMRDLDNTIKLLQDGIFRALDINDSHVVSIIADKVLLPDITEEKIFVCLEECDKTGIRYDYIPRPLVLWSEDLLLNTLLPELPKTRRQKTKQYWTDQQDEANTIIYTLTPESLTPIKAGQIMLKVIDCVVSASGFVYLAFLDNPEKQNWADEFKSLISEQKKLYSGIMIGEFKDINLKEILEWVNS